MANKHKGSLYKYNDRDFPIVSDDTEFQLWFESLRKYKKGCIPFNIVPITKLKKCGIDITKVTEKDIVGWAFQDFEHYIYFLYDIRNHRLKSNATKKQKEEYFGIAGSVKLIFENNEYILPKYEFKEEYNLGLDIYYDGIIEVVDDGDRNITISYKSNIIRYFKKYPIGCKCEFIDWKEIKE